MSGLPEITEIQRLVVKPGDRLAIRVRAPLSAQEADIIKARFMAAWPGIPLIVLPDDMTLEVVEREDP